MKLSFVKSTTFTKVRTPEKDKHCNIWMANKGLTLKHRKLLDTADFTWIMSWKSQTAQTDLKHRPDLQSLFVFFLQDTSPKLCEILQARLKPRRGGPVTSRPSPRALHLDPEFVNAPESSGANQTLEQSLENLLDREDKTANSDSEAGSTPVRAVPLTTGQIHAEVNSPTQLQWGRLKSFVLLWALTPVCVCACSDFSTSWILDPNLPAVPHQLQGSAKFRRREQQGLSYLHLPKPNSR